MELVCPAGNLPSLKAAIDHGADSVYIGFKNNTNARNFPGLNFTREQAMAAVDYVHRENKKIFLALNTYPDINNERQWQLAVDTAAELSVDAIIAADIGIMKYISQHYPALRIHLSVQASATNQLAINFYQKYYGIKRVVLPRVLSLTQVKRVAEKSLVPIEVFGFGGLCIMVEGRCALSSYVTGKSPNTSGVCSPAEFVRWEETKDARRSRLNGVLIDEFSHEQFAGYPTLCKGRFRVDNKINYAIERPASLNVIDILPQLLDIGVAAIKIEGRQRSLAYVRQVTRVMRQAIDSCMADPSSYYPRHEWITQLGSLAEGCSHTLGAYDRGWQ